MQSDTHPLSPQALEVVLALTRAGTLADAATLIGVDGSTVFRTLQRTEKGIGQRLFERSRTGYRANDLGQQLARHAERIEAELDAARSAGQAPGASVSGRVRISTTDTLLHGLLMPVLQSLAPRHPQLQFDLTASNELASLTQRDADIALRATRKPPDHLVGRHIGPIRAAVYGARPTGRRRGEAPDLAILPWIAPDEALPDHPSVRWRRRHLAAVKPQFTVNSILGVMDGIAAGLGVGIVPLFLARRRDDVVALTEALPECETQLWLLTHPESRHLRRIATVVAHLAEQLTLD
jgi:DNA-binding transcriptional LysR family regulator